MSDPTGYSPSYDFSGFQASAPSAPLPAPPLDIELDNISLAINSLVGGVTDIRRSDGALQNGIVTADALSTEMLVLLRSGGLNFRDAWVTGETYAAKDAVASGSSLYVCLVSHTAGVFATDLAAKKWTALGDTSAASISSAMAPVVGASTLALARTALGATAVGGGLFTAATAASGRAVLGVTAVGAALYTAVSAAAGRTALGSTATGDALLTAANGAAGRTALGSTGIGDALFTAVSAAAARGAIGAQFGRYENVLSLTGTTALDYATHANRLLAIEGLSGAATFTLPNPASFTSAGECIFLKNISGYSATVDAYGAEKIIGNVSTLSNTSITLTPGDSVLLMLSGTTNWVICGGTLEALYSQGTFARTLGSSCFVRVAGGIVFQTLRTGSVVHGGSAAASFLSTFNHVYGAVCTPLGTGVSANPLEVSRNLTTSGVTVYNWGGVIDLTAGVDVFAWGD